jgi:hypothetical protein
LGGEKTEREKPIAETAEALQKHKTQQLQICKSARLSHNHDDYKSRRLQTAATEIHEEQLAVEQV